MKSAVVSTRCHCIQTAIDCARNHNRPMNNTPTIILIITKKDIHAGMYLRMCYVCIYTCIYAVMYLSMYFCIYLNTSACMYVFTPSSFIQAWDWHSQSADSDSFLRLPLSIIYTSPSPYKLNHFNDINVLPLP